MGLAVTKVSSKRQGSIRDTHARKRVTSTLSKEYQAVFENTGKAMVIVEEDAIISLANAEFEKLSGYTKEEIEGKKYWTEFVVRDDRKRVKEYHLLRRTDPILAPRCFEFQFLDRQEKVKNIILTIGQIPGTNKSMASLQDVTDRRQAEETVQDKKSLEDRVESQTTELLRTNEALQAEIADLKSEVERLQRNEEHNRMLIDNIDLSINLIDSGYTIVMVNAAATKQTNKPAHELIGKKCFREFEKRDDVCPHCPGVQTMATGKLKEVEAEGVRDDGSRYKVRIQTFPVFGHDRTITGFIEIVEDITERKQMEEELRESEKRFKMLAEHVPLGISIMAPDRSFEYLNPRFTEIFGYTAEDIPDKDTWFKKAYPNKTYRKKVISMWKRDIAEEVKIGDENLRVFTVRCKDGQDKIIDFRSVDLKDGKQYLVYEDITVRARAEEALRESEERYRTLVENVDFGINLIDADHNVIMTNAALSRQFNKPVSEMIGKKCFREFEKRDAVCPHCPGVQTITTGKPAEVETGGVRDDGSRYHVRIQAFPAFGHDGTVTGFIEVVEDITERKQTEELLQQEKETFFTILQNALYGVALMEADGKHVYVNPEFTAITGYTLEDIPTGKDWMDKAYPDKAYRQEVTELWRRDSKLGWTKRVVSVVCKNGETKEIETNRTPLENGLSVVMLADITERKQMVEALRASEQHYRTLFEESLDGICLANAETGIIIDCNKAMADMVCRERADLIGKPQTILHPPQDDQEKFSLTFKQHLTDKEGQIIETQVITRTDDIREVEIKANSMNFQGRKLLQGVFRDITERKRMEEELRESEARFRKVVETMRVGLSAVDAKGVITYVNDQMCQMLGYTREEFIGHPTTDFHDEESQKRQEEIFAKRRKGLKDPTPYEITWVAKDGRKVNTILTPTPGFSPGGEFTGSFALFTDITERKRMEEALRESEERFKMLAEDAPFGISIMAPNRTFEYLNPRFTEIFGYTTEDIPDKDTWFKKAYPDKAYRNKVTSKWKRDITEAVKIGKENPRVFTVRCKDGQDKIIDFISVDLQDGKQYLVYDDITDRINAEEALRESEERFRRLIETTKVGVSAIDEKGVIIYANERLSEMWGCPMDQIIRHSSHDFLDKENLKILKEQLAKRKKGGSESYEITWTRKDGRKVPTILSPTPIFDTDGRFKGSYGFITDITERKQMEEALRESEERFRLLVEHSKDAILLHDFDGRIIDANQHACESLGYTREELLSLSIQDIDDDVLPGKHQEQWKQMVPGHPITLEGVHRRKDGTTFPVEVRLGVFESGGRKLILGLVRDVTERKLAEERLKRYAAELEQTNEEVKNFAYIVSHDLRVPLVNLKGYTSELCSALELIGPAIDTTLPHLNDEKGSAVAIALHEDVPEALEFINNSVSRMDSFINSVLILSRLGRRELKPESIDMNALVQASLDNLSYQIQEREATVTVESLPQVVADRTAMEQIMGNILGNAVKYLDPERPGRIEVTAETNNGEQIFRIRDNGRGIAEEDMHKVFAPFRRAGKQDTPGEGMGLAYVQTLVRRQEGRIWCESELGKGTTFTFTIAHHRAEGRDRVAH